LNGVLFVGYITLGHTISQSGAAAGVERLGAAMAIAFVFVFPVGLKEAAAVLTSPVLLAAGAGVGICSSVIPYICDQLAMSRLPRPTFALLLSLLPASAALIGIDVLHQIPTVAEAAGILLVMGGVALHKARDVLPTAQG